MASNSGQKVWSCYLRNLHVYRLAFIIESGEVEKKDYKLANRCIAEFFMTQFVPDSLCHNTVRTARNLSVYGLR